MFVASCPCVAQTASEQVGQSRIWQTCTVVCPINLMARFQTFVCGSFYGMAAATLDSEAAFLERAAQIGVETALLDAPLGALLSQISTIHSWQIRPLFGCW